MENIFVGYCEWIYLHVSGIVVVTKQKKGAGTMEMKNLCGKIPVALHLKVRAEIEQREISTQQFIQQVIEEHFMEKGVNRMEARTIAVQVSEQLFTRLKNAVAWKGCKQKEFLISVIEKAIEEVEAEMKQADQPDAESGE